MGERPFIVRMCFFESALWERIHAVGLNSLSSAVHGKGGIAPHKAVHASAAAAGLEKLAKERRTMRWAAVHSRRAWVGARILQRHIHAVELNDTLPAAHGKGGSSPRKPVMRLLRRRVWKSCAGAHEPCDGRQHLRDAASRHANYVSMKRTLKSDAYQAAREIPAAITRADSLFRRNTP